MNKNKLLELDVIYVNYFSYEDLIYSLKTLFESVKYIPIKCSIFLIDNSFTKADNALTEKLLFFAENFSNENFKIFYQPSDYNLGFSKGCNKGAFQGNSSKILFINCDTDVSSLRKYGLKKLIDKINKKVVIVGPKIISEKGIYQESCFRYDPISIFLKPFRHIKKIGGISRFLIKNKFIKNRINMISYEKLENSTTYVDWLSGCFMIVDRDFFEKVNGFDERFFLYFEDVDLCKKANNLNKKVLFDPTQEIVHIGKFESASKKGIIISFLTNPVSRMHISAWIKYIFKWKKDYLKIFRKLIFSIFKIK